MGKPRSSKSAEIDFDEYVTRRISELGLPTNLKDIRTAATQFENVVASVEGQAIARSHTVEPSRLAFGAWCHASEKQIGEGDIRASYSADRIGMGQPIRKPFRHAGELWACVGTGPAGAEAYRLVHPALYGGIARSYHYRCRDGDRARRDPAGFYDGIIVRHAGRKLVMAGPPTTFVAGEEAQLSLF